MLCCSTYITACTLQDGAVHIVSLNVSALLAAPHVDGNSSGGTYSPGRDESDTGAAVQLLQLVLPDGRPMALRLRTNGGRKGQGASTSTTATTTTTTTSSSGTATASSRGGDGCGGGAICDDVERCTTWTGEDLHGGGHAVFARCGACVLRCSTVPSWECTLPDVAQRNHLGMPSNETAAFRLREQRCRRRSPLVGGCECRLLQYKGCCGLCRQDVYRPLPAVLLDVGQVACRVVFWVSSEVSAFRWVFSLGAGWGRHSGRGGGWVFAWPLGVVFRRWAWSRACPAVAGFGWAGGFVLIVGALRSCCWGEPVRWSPSGPWVSGGVLCVSGSVGLGLWLVSAAPPLPLRPLVSFACFPSFPRVPFILGLFGPAPLVLFCSVCFSSSSSLGVPCLRLGFIWDWAFGGAGACLRWLG